MKRIVVIVFLIFSITVYADSISVNGRLKEVEYAVKQVEANQINYRIEKDLLKETYSNNYERINMVITIVLGIFGVLGYLGLKDISGTKKEYEKELNSLRNIKGEFDLKSQELKADKLKFEEDLKSIIEKNEEQSRKIKLIEIREKVNNLIKDKSSALALEFVNVALDISPNDADLLNKKGIILCRLNQMSQAVESFTQALNINPTDNSIILNTAECMYFANDISSAKSLIDKHKTVFDNKEDGQLYELFKIIELFYDKKKEDLLQQVNLSVDFDNLSNKSKKFNIWDLQESQYWIYYQPEDELKTIVQNLFWFWDGQITGETVLERLKIEIPKKS